MGETAVKIDGDCIGVLPSAVVRMEREQNTLGADVVYVTTEGAVYVIADSDRLLGPITVVGTA